MIRFDNVCKRYPGGHVGLENVSFHLRRGEIAFLTGHSGAGKSTLLKLIMRMEQASTGQVLVGGHNVKDLNRGQIPTSAGISGWCFRIISCCSTVLFSITLPCR